MEATASGRLSRPSSTHSSKLTSAWRRPRRHTPVIRFGNLSSVSYRTAAYHPPFLCWPELIPQKVPEHDATQKTIGECLAHFLEHWFASHRWIKEYFYIQYNAFCTLRFLQRFRKAIYEMYYIFYLTTMVYMYKYKFYLAFSDCKFILLPVWSLL